MRVAFVGKGGSGKSMVAGTVCRQLGRLGHPVLALDVDTMPGLAFSLGAPKGEARLPDGLAERVEGKGWRILRKGTGAVYLVDRYASRAPDGVRFLELGKLPERVEPAVTVAFRHVMERFKRSGWDVVADLAAGTRQPMFRWARFAQTVVVVVEPTVKSTLTARRLLPVATHLVASKVRSKADLEMICAAVSLPLLEMIPYDAAVAEAERNGLAPIDFAPDAPAVAASGRLAQRLTEVAGRAQGALR